MDKWNPLQFSDFLEAEKANCYYFWFKGKVTCKRDKRDNLEITETVNQTGEWNGIRFKNGFNHCFDILTNKYMRGLKEGKYNGQTKVEFEKDKVRVSDIWIKSGGDVDKAITLAKTQANGITNEWKALNISSVARKIDQEEIFEVFFHRAYELGSVSKLEYREYKLEKLGI